MNRLNLVIIFSIGLLFSVSTKAASLPSEVYINSKTAITDGYYSFALYNNKIWIKKNSFPAKKKPFFDIYDSHMSISYQWSLFFNTGIPLGLPEGKKLTQIMADMDTFIAIDEDRKVYKFGHRIGYKGNPKIFYRHWSSKWGAPFKSSLYIPENTMALAVGRNNPESLYYEDLSGNKIHFGPMGLTHIYALSNDGMEIHFADTGLPPDMSRQKCGPEMGSFKSVNISASGVTLFLIGNNGDLFTKYEDYDSNGGTPFLDFYYGERNDLPSDKETIRRYTFPRRLPLPDWRKQPRINGGIITKNITILTTGEGPGERELRVQGKNEHGENGYFTKKINEDNWNFIKTDQPILKEDIISNNTLDFSLGKSKTRHFTGLLKDSKNIDKIEIPNFHFYCSPMDFNLVLKDGKTIKLILHTVDAWVWHTMEDPEYSDLEMKRLKATLEIPKDILESTDQNTQEAISKFKDFHLKTFRISIVANKNFGKIEGRILGQKKSAFKLDIFSDEKETEKKSQHFNSYTSDTSLEYLENENKETLPELISKNFKAIKRMTKEFTKVLARKKLVHTYSNVIKGLKDFVSYVEKKRRGPDEFSNSIVRNLYNNQFALERTAYWADQLIFESTRQGLNEAVEIINKRICQYFNDYLEFKKLNKEQYLKLNKIQKHFIFPGFTKELSICH